MIDQNSEKMEQKTVHQITFDLEILESALRRLVEVCKEESEMMYSRSQIDTQKLDALYSEKLDLMNYVDWNIPLIVQYIASHKDMPALKDKDQINQLIELASKIEVTNNIANANQSVAAAPPESNSDIQSENTTTTAQASDDDTIVQIKFLNDAPDKATLILELLKQSMIVIRDNFNSIMHRRKFNDHIMNVMSEMIAEQNKKVDSYNPTTKKSEMYSKNSHAILNEDC